MRIQNILLYIGLIVNCFSCQNESELKEKIVLEVHYPNGELKRSEKIIYDSINYFKVEEYYDSGFKKFKGFYKDTSMIGLCSFYDEKGNLEAEINYKDDVKHGVASYYFEEGNLRSSINYKNDTIIGKALYYYQNNSVKQYSYYDTDNGDLIYRRQYSIEGKITEQVGTVYAEVVINEIQFNVAEHLQLEVRPVMPPGTFSILKLKIYNQISNELIETIKLDIEGDRYFFKRDLFDKGEFLYKLELEIVTESLNIVRYEGFDIEFAVIE